MTREEHVARAMLLGRTYREAHNVYAGSHCNGTTGYLDADTLEPVTSLQYMQRIINEDMRPPYDT